MLFVGSFVKVVGLFWWVCNVFLVLVEIVLGEVGVE